DAIHPRPKGRGSLACFRKAPRPKGGASAFRQHFVRGKQAGQRRWFYANMIYWEKKQRNW
ncbi:MAG: hypothetical protein JSV60_11310, partial [Desulfobacterales bacterium]